MVRTNEPSPRVGRAEPSTRPGRGPVAGRLRPWRRRLLALLVVPGLLLAAGGLLLAVYAFANVPLPEDVVPQATRVFDRNGNEAGALSPHAVQPVQLSTLPDYVKYAVLSAEDRSFYRHGGVSVTATLRALIGNLRSREVDQGGSTITQQYIKNAAVGNERTFSRKVKEAVLAVKLEQRYSKDQILEFYLNTIYLGRGTYGIEAAARTYFGVPAQQLTLNQASTIAGMIQGPELLDPTKSPRQAEARRRYVLDGMVEQGWLDPEQRDRTVAQGLPTPSPRQDVEAGPIAYYLDAVRQELAQDVGQDRIYKGLSVYTELDVPMQTAAQKVLSKRIAELAEQQRGRPVSGALVTVDPATGGVRALVGGPNFEVQPFNAAVQGRNQAGSAFKPFGLAAFVEAGNSPDSRFPAPPKTTVGFPDGQQYEVTNFGGNGFGEQSVREATWTSTNTVYAQVAAVVGPQRVKDVALRAGIRDEGGIPAVPSLILGTADVSAVDMADAYATFAAGGAHHAPRLVKRVTDRRGSVLLDRKSEADEAIQRRTAYVVSDILKANVERGTATGAQIGRPAAGKTGTTNDSKDAWFVGYVPQLSTAVWFGTLDDTPMDGVTGGSIPAQTWAEYMTEAVKDLEPLDFPPADYAGLKKLNEPPPAPPPPPPAPSPTAVTATCPAADGQTQQVQLKPGESCPPVPGASPTAVVVSPTAPPTAAATTAAPQPSPSTSASAKQPLPQPTSS